ncbi:Pre-rRNA-processing protein crb3/ipi3 [Fulvia fulva]|uniref:Pre-rRNA-processing protein IPI3 n=1 Tax=Passalora fulva TaxID=5499 RepID=A0A9Q8PMR4_PASFU|nr:Pre-rRNA-processing protein crb3/ipi3 [Fulvia fulva]KAK4609253.1 Pre-rRNA-processing protein crb3/ipi3 [Fulvia fulva]KAK4610019.1 Pre-rRNA-processing protein crb3/ipi3 [Fulvia fulva]UJO25291.1 Pre-rRNA-processing protein crb3/ipi3 [Fulvia fulva]WPV22810.1 Pre-rRNA-processing protein crb3/ipi3 [Fulvia fulva]WPV37661.1 Pre-rRNA-processing protein crb3/ipi3 [Fulvia fulva]
MLTESFIASVGVSAKAAGTNVAKDATILLHEYQPLSQQRAIYKKSATPRNCLAVSETHIFAAQADKAAVHVYNRAKGNQEATVPFTERISSIALACDDSVLIIGTVEGRVFLWEICTGRQVTTGQLHLQAVTALAVDPTSNFLLSASKDSTVLVWSIPALLSFSSINIVSQLRTFDSHHSEVVTLAVGHSSSRCNIAVTASKDKTCLVWDYHTGNLLRTYLLPDVPLSIALDPADRAVYIGYEDGSLQQLDLYTAPSGALDAVQNAADATTPLLTPNSSRWKLQDTTHGPALSLSVSFDGSVVTSGHQSGTVVAWDTARGNFISSVVQPPLPGPVNNLSFLPVDGFGRRDGSSTTKAVEIVKPKFGAFDSGGSGTVPGNYTIKTQFASSLTFSDNVEPSSSFIAALTAPMFPTALLDEGLAELASWNSAPARGSDHKEHEGDDSMALDNAADKPNAPSVEDENTDLKRQVAALRRVQQKTFEKMDKLNLEKKGLLQREQKRLASKAIRNSNGHVKADTSSDEDMG